MYIKMSVEALFKIVKIWKQPKYPSTEDWIKMWNICTMKYYSATERNEIMPVCWSRGLNCPSLGGYASV